MDAVAALFDLDGTLIDSLADIAASTNHVRACFGLDPLPEHRVRRMIGDGARVLLERALTDAPEHVDPAEAWPIYAAHHEEQCIREVRPYPGAEDCLHRWHHEGRRLAVVTNKPERFATRVLDHLGLLGCFGTVIGGDTLTAKKPDPEPLRRALQDLRADPREALMVGDGVQDLRAGKAAGLRTAAALYGFHDAGVLRAEGADEYWVAFDVTET
jgi:phosphoglycolate phosphatase